MDFSLVSALKISSRSSTQMCQFDSNVGVSISLSLTLEMSNLARCDTTLVWPKLSLQCWLTLLSVAQHSGTLIEILPISHFKTPSGHSSVVINDDPKFLTPTSLPPFPISNHRIPSSPNSLYPNPNSSLPPPNPQSPCTTILSSPFFSYFE